MSINFSPQGKLVSALLLLARVLGGGALVMAGVLKMLGGAKPLALSIDSFHLVPVMFQVPLGHFLPFLEIVLGGALVFGLWSRQAALLAAGLYTAFSLGIVSILVRGMDIDCGCFGDFFGSGAVDHLTLVRNGVLITATVCVLVFGGGLFAVERERVEGVD